MSDVQEKFAAIDANKRRPTMKNYGVSQKAQGMLSWAWVDEQMTKSRNYWVCSTRADGRPHAAPVWGVWVEGALYFGTSPTSVKGRNLKARPDVVIHLESGDNTVIFEGVVETFSGEKALGRRIAEAYYAKYGGEEPDLDNEDFATWLTLKPSRALAWTESDFPQTATRWDF